MAKENKSPVSKKVEDIKPEDKRKALETALTQIKKQFGEGAVMRLGQNNGMHVDAISTGSLSLDLALGIGGLPRGRIIEIYGPESSGKTTLALHILAEAQKRGGEVAFVDAEHALDPVYAAALGVDIDNLLVSQPDTGEDIRNCGRQYHGEKHSQPAGAHTGCSLHQRMIGSNHSCDRIDQHLEKCCIQNQCYFGSIIHPKPHQKQRCQCDGRDKTKQT